MDPAHSSLITLTLAMNSPSLLFRHSKTNWYYMLGWDAWLKTSDLEKGRWVTAGKLPSAFSKLPDEPLWRALKKMIPGRKLEAHDVPKVYVATEPTELIVTFGEATFQPVPGTALTYVDNTESDVFLNSKDGMYYALLAGRWFRTRGQGALEFCSQALPDDFSEIPPEHPAGRVLASVPGTEASTRPAGCSGGISEKSSGRESVQNSSAPCPRVRNQRPASSA